MDFQFYQDMVQHICRAALAPSEWQGVLNRLSDRFGGLRGHLLSFDLRNADAMATFHSGFDEPFVKAYNDHYQYTNPWAPVWARNPVGTFVAAYDMLPREDLEATEFFHDWVKPQENAQAGGGIVLVREASRVFMLGGNLPLGELERSQQGFSALITALAPILRHAIEVNRLLGAQHLETLALREGVSDPAAALLVISDAGNLLSCNRVADALLAEGQVIRSGLFGRLGFADDALQTRLQAALRPGRPVEPMAFGLKAGTVRFEGRLVPISDDLSAFLTSGILRPDRAAGLMILRQAEDDQMPLAGLARNFGLTQSEVEVAVLLHQGLMPSEIAEMRGVSRHTVRNQIRSALLKSESRRQADLIRMIEAHLARKSGGGSPV